MDRVNQYLFYEFGASLRRLRTLEVGGEYLDGRWQCALAVSALNKFLLESAHVPLQRSKDSARTLLKVLLDYIESQDPRDALEPGVLHLTERLITVPERNSVIKALDDFEAVFSNEAQALEVFSIPQKCAYSTTTLINQGENVLPPSIRDFVSVYAKEEMHETGRCLAFGLPTAAGFHMMRSLESVLHNYWDVVSGGKPRPTLSNGNPAAMGGYISAAEKEGANPKAIAALRQIKDLHRNPLIHPDAVLSEPEGIVLLGVVTSAIAVMVEEMKSKGLTAAPPS